MKLHPVSISGLFFTNDQGGFMISIVCLYSTYWLLGAEQEGGEHLKAAQIPYAPTPRTRDSFQIILSTSFWEYSDTVILQTFLKVDFSDQKPLCNRTTDFWTA